VTKSVVPSGIAASLLVLSVRGTIISANAQSTFGSIVGVVHDSTQAVVPDASVKIRSLEDNSTRSTTSDQNGSFEFVNLKPGNYTLSAEAPGFAEFQVPSAELTARQTLRIDVTLGIKSQSQTVEVADTVAVINTENAVISDSINNLQITELPLNNRATPPVMDTRPAARRSAARWRSKCHRPRSSPSPNLRHPTPCFRNWPVRRLGADHCDSA